MKINEIVNHELQFVTKELQVYQLLIYYQNHCEVNEDIITGSYFPGKMVSSQRQRRREDNNEIATFVDLLNNIDSNRTIKVGDLFSVISYELVFGYKEILVYGWLNPKLVENIHMGEDERISYVELNNGDRWPRHTEATFSGKPVMHSIYFDSKESAESALMLSKLAVPNEWEMIIDEELL